MKLFQTLAMATVGVIGLGCDQESRLPTLNPQEPGGSQPLEFISTEDSKPAPQPKVVQVGPQVFLEIEPQKRSVVISSKVVRREGLLELLLCREKTKEHESILATGANAKDIHQAMLGAGLKSGTPVQFVPQFRPASGQALDIKVRFKDSKGQDQTVPARDWIRKTMTTEALKAEWVFGGSKLVPNLQDPKGPPYFLANDGDLISISNFESSLIDLSIKVSDSNSELNFEPWTEKIPALGTPVAIIITAKTEK